MRGLLLLALAAATAWSGEYTTYIGDSGDYHVARIRADAAGNTYIAGNRTSPDASSAFVMKLDPAGNIAVFNVFSGKGTDTVNDLAVDAAGDFYVAGATNSLYLPVRSAYQSTPGPGFLMKLTPDAEQVVFATYFPAPIQALAVDADGSVYVTGTTNLPTFPVTPGMPAGRVTTIYSISAASGAFITKLSASGDRILYSGLLAGHAWTCGCCSSCFTGAVHTAGIAIALDPAGSAYVAGFTDTSDLPTTPGALLGKGEGAFVVKVNAAGTGLEYLTYLTAGGYPSGPQSNPATTASSIAVDAAGNAYIAGATSDPQFPATKGAFQTAFSAPAAQTSLIPPSDAFVLKLNPGGTAALWGSYLGGRGVDSADSMAVDAAGNVWIAGNTASADFPNAQGWSEGGDFVAEFNSAGSALPYSARFPAVSVAQSLAIDSAGVVHVAGAAGLISALVPAGTPLMRIFGVANAAYGPVSGRIVEGEVISLYGPHICPSKPVTAIANSTGALPTSLAGVQVLAIENGANPSPLSLLYVSDSQINAVVPYGVSGASALRIVQGSISSPDFAIAMINGDPEIFQNADGSAAAVNQDGSINSASHPAPIGSTVSVWATGAGLAAYSDSSRIASTAHNTYCCAVTMGLVPAYVSYAGDAPGAVGGVVQINFEIPPAAYDIFTGLSQFFVEAGGSTSHFARIYVLSRPPAAPAYGELQKALQ